MTPPQRPAAKHSAAKPRGAKRRRAAEQPTTEQPTTEQPTAEQPTAEQPTAEQPTAEQPTAEQPTAEQPTAEQPADSAAAPPGPAAVPPARLTIDALGRKCPIPIIMLAERITEVPVGEVVSVLTDDPAARTDVPAWCLLKSQEFLMSADLPDSGWAFLVRRSY